MWISNLVEVLFRQKLFGQIYNIEKGSKIMMKVKKMLSAIVVGVLLVANVIPVSAAEKPTVKAGSLEEVNIGQYAQYIMDAEQQEPVVQPKAPAPALTSFKLYAIYSEKAGEEIISQSSSFMQVGSTLDHGGTWFQAITVEVGYAKTRFAYFNNIQMTLTDIAPLDFDNDSIVDGYLCLWTYEGSEYEAGTFTANSTSANSPWNTMSLRFNVY